MTKRQKIWVVTKIGARGKFLGTVSAPNEKAALKLAIKSMSIRAEDKKRIVVQAN
jgi:hypothetical protein